VLIQGEELVTVGGGKDFPEMVLLAVIGVLADIQDFTESILGGYARPSGCQTKTHRLDATCDKQQQIGYQWIM
jgi:hypothetical protein